MREERTERVVLRVSGSPGLGDYLLDLRRCEVRLGELKHQGFQVIEESGSGVFRNEWVLERKAGVRRGG